MAREIPDGWKRVDNYAMTHGKLTICRTYHNDVMFWNLFKTTGPKIADYTQIFRGRDDEGAYAEAVMIAKELEEIA